MNVWDWIIIGSGFGGSVSALRLAEKGYSVLVLEKGARWQPQDFPRSNWNLRRWLWMPALGFRGFFKMTFFRHLTALSGVGVGGGSLVYANTLPKPPDHFFTSGDWRTLADWKDELDPHYETARRMLGATENPHKTAPDRVLEAIAPSLGIDHEVRPAPVAVFFGKPGEPYPDPYFQGRGPSRVGCTLCGGCMTGCRYGAKNTLDQNYLWLAEKLGVEVQPDTEVTWVRPIGHQEPSGDTPDAFSREARYVVTARRRLKPFTYRTQRFQARNVIFAGGVLGTVDLLLRLKASADGLPELSPRLGDRLRTNSEVLIGVTSLRKELDFSEGVAITSLLKTDEHSSIEPVRFSSGSGFFRILSTPHASGRSLAARVASGLLRVLRTPFRFVRSIAVQDWARRTAILLYMRTQEGYLRLEARQGVGRVRHFPFLLRRRLRTRRAEGPAPTASIPEATALADAFAREVDGQVGSILTETVFGIPTTAHILGGACMGANREDGVIDRRHRVFGYEGLFVIDGSSVSANPGVNPSLTITALAERAISFISSKEKARMSRRDP